MATEITAGMTAVYAGRKDFWSGLNPGDVVMVEEILPRFGARDLVVVSHGDNLGIVLNLEDLLPGTRCEP